MQSSSLASADFSALISRRGRFDIDLTGKTLIEVIKEYEKYKRGNRPAFSLSAVIYNLKMVEVMAGGALMPEDVTDVFYDMFSSWLTNRGVNYSSQMNYCASIRAVLGWGLRHRCSVSSTYDNIDIPVYSPFTIALTPDEVSHIAHFDIYTIPVRPQKKRTLEKVRDMFVLSCQLGQRFSDVKRISIENFERNMFSCVQQKTGCRCHLDIDRYSMMPKHTYKLIKKYNGNAPYGSDISNYDKYLHELMKYIGHEFNDEYKIEHKVQGKVKVVFKKKWELVASHTARRTFVTYNSFRQIPIAELMKATGHKSISCFQKYIRFGED